MEDHKLSFKKLDYDDLELMSKWLSSSEVKKWYPVSDPSIDGVKKKYTPVIQGTEPINAYIVVIDGQKGGYVQGYWCKDFPNPELKSCPPDHSCGLDIFIGEESFRGQGLGPRVLSAFLHEIIFGCMGAKHCLVDPQVSNLRAIRAYQAVGFRHFATSSGEAECYQFLIVDRR